MTEATLREEICRIGKSLFERGYVHATAGNISLRLDDGFLMTPTDACLGALDPARLAKMDLTLNVSDAAVAELAKVGFDPVFGARPLKRAIQQRIENPLSKLLLEGKFLPKDTIQVGVDPIQAPGQFSFS